MNHPQQCSWASAYQNQNIIWIHTDSGYRASVYDPDGKEAVLRTNGDENAMGIAVQEALAHSRTVPVDEARAFLDYRRTQPTYDLRLQSIAEKYGYKDKAALLRKMKRCSITATKDVITFGPSIHRKLDAWGRTKSDGIEDVIIPIDSTPSEIGSALTLAFSRCVA